MRWAFLGMWILLVVDLVFLSPPPATDQTAWILEVFLGQWGGKNPATVALFSIMGLWPLAFAAQLSDELRARPLPAWPFVLGSMVIGAFALLPYLVLRPTPPEPVPPGPWLWWLRHPVFIGGIAVSGLGLACWELLAGDIAGFWTQLRSEQLVQVMSLDCLLLAITMLTLQVRK
jgi:hypothetical protein